MTVKKIHLEVVVEDDVCLEFLTEGMKEHIDGIIEIRDMQPSGLIGLYRAKGSADSQ